MRCWRSAVCVLPLFLLPLAAVAAPLYHVTDIGGLPGGPTYFNGSVHGEAYGISDTGAVVGYSLVQPATTQPLSVTRAAWMWTPSNGFQQIGTLDTNLSAAASGDYASGVNDSGQVVGYEASDNFSPPRAFQWSSADGIQNFGTNTGILPLSPAKINNAGTVVGSGYNGVRGFHWTSGGGLQDLGALPGSTHSRANDINASGQIAGMGGVAAGEPRRAALWTTSGIQNLGDLEGGTDLSEAFGLNDNGQVVGYSSATGGTHAFVWDSTQGMQDLGVLAGSNLINSVAFDVNNSGHVVGYSATSDRFTTNFADPVFFPPFTDRAFLWTSSDGMLDLNTHLDSSGTGWVLVRAMAINNSGQIVGVGANFSLGGPYRAFLLTPVPKPSTFVLGLMALAALGICKAGRGHQRAK